VTYVLCFTFCLSASTLCPVHARRPTKQQKHHQPHTNTQLFDADKARARRAAISDDIARGHFDDLAGAKSLGKPWPARSFPPGPRRPALPALQCVDALAPRAGGPPADWRAWLAPGTLVLVGLRASAEAGLDSWAAAYADAFFGDGGGGGSGVDGPNLDPLLRPTPRIVDLTVNDRTPALALALPGMKAALLKGAAAGAARRRAAVAATHFGRAPDLRAALRLTNALAAHAAVVGRVGGTAGHGEEDGSGLGVAWLGSGLAEPEEAAAMVAAAAAEGGWSVGRRRLPG
jgi:hypothetical protein